MTLLAHNLTSVIVCSSDIHKLFVLIEITDNIVYVRTHVKLYRNYVTDNIGSVHDRIRVSIRVKIYTITSLLNIDAVNVTVLCGFTLSGFGYVKLLLVKLATLFNIVVT